MNETSLPGYHPSCLISDVKKDLEDGVVVMQNCNKDDQLPDRCSLIQRGIKFFQYFYSSLLLIFSVALLMSSMAQAPGHGHLFGIISILIFWILIMYLGCLEGGQNALVGLQTAPPSRYRKSHPCTAKAVEITSHGNNLQRFLMGRQLLIIFLIFGVTSVGNISDQCSLLVPLPWILSYLFCKLGLALILVTILLGQVTCQILSTKYMREFINNRIFLLTVYLALGIECSGVLHVIHFSSGVFDHITGSSGCNNDIVTPIFHILHWSRVILSFICLGFSLACIVTEILLQHTTMWSNLNPIFSILLFFLLLLLLGVFEGLQIALFATSNMRPTLDTGNEIPSPLSRSDSNSIRIDLSPPSPSLALPSSLTIAQRNCLYVFSAKNFSSFVVGRQICVTILTFIIARITTLNPHSFPSTYTTFGFPSSLQTVINTGILQAFTTTILGSLIFRVIASQYPLEFLSLPLTYPLIRLCICMESTGIIRFANSVARLLRNFLRMKSDEIYCQEEELNQTGDPIVRVVQ